MCFKKVFLLWLCVELIIYILIYFNSDPDLVMVREDRARALKDVRALSASFQAELESRKFKKQAARILLPTAPARKAKRK